MHRYFGVKRYVLLCELCRLHVRREMCECGHVRTHRIIGSYEAKTVSEGDVSFVQGWDGWCFGPSVGPCETCVCVRLCLCTFEYFSGREHVCVRCVYVWTYMKSTQTSTLTFNPSWDLGTDTPSVLQYFIQCDFF